MRVGLLAFLMCLALSGCRIGYDLLPEPDLDASSDAPATVDADMRSDASVDGGIDGGPPRIDPHALASPAPIAALMHPLEDDDPSLTDDLLELYFSSSRTGSKDIWRSVRASPSDDWGPPSPVTEVNSGATDEQPGISSDGLTLWLSSSRGGGGENVFVATRQMRGESFSIPAPEATLNAPDSMVEDVCCEPSRDGLRIVFYRIDPSRDLFEAVRDDLAASWQTPQPIAELNTPTGHELSPYLFDDSLRMLFTNDSDGDHDIYVVERADPSSPFGPVERLEAIASPARDDDAWISPDGRYMVFSSERSGNGEIWEARTP